MKSSEISFNNPPQEVIMSHWAITHKCTLNFGVLYDIYTEMLPWWGILWKISWSPHEWVFWDIMRHSMRVIWHWEVYISVHAVVQRPQLHYVSNPPLMRGVFEKSHKMQSSEIPQTLLSLRGVLRHHAQVASELQYDMGYIPRPKTLQPCQSSHRGFTF